MFENFLLACDVTTATAARKRALLLNALEAEGQRIYYTLPDPSISAFQTIFSSVNYATTDVGSSPTGSSTIQVLVPRLLRGLPIVLVLVLKVVILKPFVMK